MKLHKTLPFLLIPFSLAPAQERIGNGTFAGQQAGAVPDKPWIVPPQVTQAKDVSVTVQPLPGQENSSTWVKLADADAKLPSGMVQSFSEIQNGRLKVKVYFERVGTAFGIYLGAPKVASPESRIVDFKVLKGGKLSLGNAGVRAKTDFVFEPGRIYPLVFDFTTNPETKKVIYTVKLEDSGEVIGSAEVDARVPISGMRIATDSLDETTIAYVSDISLTDKE